MSLNSHDKSWVKLVTAVAKKAAIACVLTWVYRA